MLNLKIEQKINAHNQLKVRMVLLDAISATPSMLAKGCSIHISGDEAAYEDNVAVFEGFTASNFVGEVGNGSRCDFTNTWFTYIRARRQK